MAAQLHERRSVRAAYMAAGFVSLGVGLAGIVLPLIPTTGPVLLAAFFFARSSERFHQYLLNHPRFGPSIRDYQAGLGIPLRAKITAVVMIAVTFTVSMLLVVRNTGGRMALIALAVGICAFILSRPTKASSTEVPAHRAA